MIWQDPIPPCKEKDQKLYEIVKNDKKTARLLYERLKTDDTIYMSKAWFWRRVFQENFEPSDIVTIINNMYQITISTKLHSFHFRLVNNAITTNIQLKYYKIRDNDSCTFCNGDRETISHLFIHCKFVQPLWNRVMLLC